MCLGYGSAYLSSLNFKLQFFLLLIFICFSKLDIHTHDYKIITNLQLLEIVFIIQAPQLFQAVGIWM